MYADVQITPKQNCWCLKYFFVTQIGLNIICEKSNKHFLIKLCTGPDFESGVDCVSENAKSFHFWIDFWNYQNQSISTWQVQPVMYGRVTFLSGKACERWRHHEVSFAFLSRSRKTSFLVISPFTWQIRFFIHIL